MAGRFPLLTDESVDGRIVLGLRHAGWDVVRAVDLVGEHSDDEDLLRRASFAGRALASTDADHLVIANRWLRAGRTDFRLVYWEQGSLPVGQFVDGFERLAGLEGAFAGCIEYLK